MDNLLRDKIRSTYNQPINSAKDCNLLAETIIQKTNRNISSTTLRRFFGLLPSASNLSKYNLDTLAIYCGEKDYATFVHTHQQPSTEKTGFSAEQQDKLKKLTSFTLNSIAKKSLGDFKETIPRKNFNRELNRFLHSEHSLFPVIAPGDYGKSIALAHRVQSAEAANYEVLFCSAALFMQLTSPSNNLKNELNINMEHPGSLVASVSTSQKPLVIIIDSMDELSSDVQKIQSLFYFLVALPEQNPGKIKIVFSIRESLWNHLVKMEVIQQLTRKNQVHMLYQNETDYNRFPRFSVTEITRMFEKYQEIEGISLHYHSIPFPLQDIVRIPINFYFLLQLLKKDKSLDAVSINRLTQKYIREFVFTSKFAESKEDILWTLIELIEKEASEFTVPKDILKKLLPIHLKREPDYYHGYKKFITNGILHEERVENQFGIFKTKVGFRHQNFFYYLTALNQINRKGTLNFSLLKEIVQSEKNLEWKSNTISILYEIAYENQDKETLEDFCLLPQEILYSPAVKFSVGNSFRIKNAIRHELIQKYASCPDGQTYFFEQFVDTNYIINNYEERIKAYLKYKKTKEARLFGHSILFLAGFLKMDVQQCEKHFKIIDSIKPDKNIHPWPIGRKVSIHILYDYFIKKEPSKNIVQWIKKYQDIAYQYPDYLKNGLVEFELPIFVVLILIGNYQPIIRLYDKLMTSYHIKLTDEFSFGNIYNQNIFPFLFAEFAKQQLGIKPSENYLRTLEKTIDHYPHTFDDFQYKILLNYFLFKYYQDHNPEKAKEHF